MPWIHPSKKINVSKRSVVVDLKHSKAFQKGFRGIVKLIKCLYYCWKLHSKKRTRITNSV